MPKVSSQMRFDETLYKKTKIIAEAELRSVNAQIEYFMKQGIAAFEREYGIIDLSEED